MEILGCGFQTQDFPQIVVVGNKQECIPVGCVLSAAVAVSDRVVFRGVSRVYVCKKGCICVQGDVWPRMYTSPPVNRITDRCNIITFPHLCLRTVIKYLDFWWFLEVILLLMFRLHQVSAASTPQQLCNWTVPEDTVPTNVYTSSYIRPQHSTVRAHLPVDSWAG